MFGYLEKFKNLPPDIRNEISSPETVDIIIDLEKKYGVSLAVFVIKVMVGEIYYNNLASNLIKIFKLEPESAFDLEKEFKDKIFSPVWGYLESAFAPARPEKSFPPANSPAFSKRPEKITEEKFLPREKKIISLDEADSSHLLVEKNETKNAKPKSEQDFLNEDEKEIEKIKNIAEIDDKSGEFKNKIESRIEEIVREAKISFSSSSLEARFRQIISTYLRGVREKIIAKQTMVRQVAEGGLGLNEFQADKILAIAEGKKIEEKNGKDLVNIKSTENGANFIFNREEINKALKEKENFQKESFAPKAEIEKRGDNYDLASALRARKDLPVLEKKEKTENENMADEKQAVQTAPAIERPIDINKENKIIPDLKIKNQDSILSPIVGKTSSGPAKFGKDSVLGETSSKFSPSSSPSSSPAPAIKESLVRTIAPSSGKKKIEDIKTPKIMGPIDELLYLDMVNFRRLDSSPERRAKKIEEKIKLLSREGIDKMIEGISAWRRNPVMRTYLAMGHESMEQGKEISDIMAERKQNGLNYLDIEEFEAIMDLNNRLRF